MNNYWVFSSVIVRGRVDYSDPAQVARINQLLLDLEASHYINPHLTKSWLRSDNNTVRFAIRIHNETGNNHVTLLIQFQMVTTSFVQKEGKNCCKRLSGVHLPLKKVVCIMCLEYLVADATIFFKFSFIRW